MADPKPNLLALIQQAAQRYNPNTPGVDFADLLRRLVQQESGGDPNSISSAGAIGYGQLMPGTARDLGVNPYNPQENLMGSARYLAQGLKQYGNANDALSRYNSGLPYNKGRNIPQTRDYVSRITGGKGLGALPSSTRSAVKPGRGQGVMNSAPAQNAGQTYNDPYAAQADTLIQHLMRSVNGPPLPNPYTTPAPQLNQALGVTDPNQTPLGIEAALARLATQGPTPYDTQLAGAQSELAGNQALQGYYGEHPLPTASAAHFQYPQVPTREELPIPNRPAPRSDLGGALLGLLGGVIDPHSAGYYNAAPLQAATQYANQQYQDNLTRYQLGTEQAANRYSDQRFGYGQSVDEQIRNQEAQQEAERINQGRQIVRTDTLAQPTAAIAAGQSLTGALPGLAAGARQANEAQGQLGVVGNYIQQEDRMNQLAQGNDTRQLGILGSLISRSQNALYQQAMAGQGQQKVQTQQERNEETARHNKAMEGLRLKARTSADADPVMNQYRQLRNQLMQRHLNEPVLSPTQQFELKAAQADMQSSEGLFRQAMYNRNMIDAAIAEGRINDLLGDVDPVLVRQEAYSKAEEARQTLDTSLKRYSNLIGGLPQAPGPSVLTPALPSIPPPGAGMGQNMYKGFNTPAATSQSTLPANPKAGKKAPPKPPAKKPPGIFDATTGKRIQ